MAMANQILPIHKEPNKRNSITQKAIFCRLRLPSFSPEAIDEAIRNIRDDFKKDEKEELFICFTDVKSTPHNIVRKLLEKQITIIQQDIHTKICFANHFWRFSNYEKEKIQFVLYTGNDFLEEVEFHKLLEVQVTYHPIIHNGIQNENIADTSLVLSNYPNNLQPEEIIAIMTKVFEDSGINIPKVTEKKNGYSIFEFENEQASFIVMSKLQNSVLHFYPNDHVVENNTETSESEMETDHQDPCEKQLLLDNPNQQPGRLHLLEHENVFATDGEQPCAKMYYQDRKTAFSFLKNDIKTMAIVFWDFQNCKFLKSEFELVPEYIKHVRKTLITSGYEEEAFVCVCDVYNTPDRVIQDLSNSGVIIVHMHTEKKQTADKVLITFLEQYSSNRPGNARIILITGDQDYLDTIYRTLIIDRNEVCLIHRGNSVEEMKMSVEKKFDHDDIKRKLRLNVQINNPQTVNYTLLDEHWVNEELQISGHLINNHPYYTFVCDEKVSAERYSIIFEKLNKMNYSCKVMNICYSHDSFFVKNVRRNKQQESQS